MWLTFFSLSLFLPPSAEGNSAHAWLAGEMKWLSSWTSGALFLCWMPAAGRQAGTPQERQGSRREQGLCLPYKTTKQVAAAEWPGHAAEPQAGQVVGPLAQLLFWPFLLLFSPPFTDFLPLSPQMGRQAGCFNESNTVSRGIAGRTLPSQSDLAPQQCSWLWPATAWKPRSVSESRWWCVAICQQHMSSWLKF